MLKIFHIPSLLLIKFKTYLGTFLTGWIRILVFYQAGSGSGECEAGDPQLHEGPPTTYHPMVRVQQLLIYMPSLFLTID